MISIKCVHRITAGHPRFTFGSFLVLPRGGRVASGHGDGADRVMTFDEPIDRARLGT